MAEEQTVRFRVFGRVQGVGFRWWTRSRARDLGLLGTVANLDDGSVEVVATGSPTTLTALRAALQQGPAGAAVERVEETPAEPVHQFDFKIR